MGDSGVGQAIGMQDSTHELLMDAIARGSGAVISLPSAGMLRSHKTRFLGESEGGFWVESIPGEAELIDELIVAQSLAGIAFRSGPNKVIFTTPVWRRQPEYAVNAMLKLEALLLPFPQSIKTVQRRSAYRVFIPTSSELVVRCWKISEHAVLRDRPSATQELALKVHDVSVGGMGVVCPPKDGEPLRLVFDQRLRVFVQFRQHEALVEGCVRYTQSTPDKSLRVGVQFKKLENDLEGRQTLSKLTAIVGELHREEVRRLRLGLTG